MASMTSGVSDEGHFIEGSRIYLRGVCPDDVDARYHRWMNDPEVTRFLESRFVPKTQSELRDFVVDLIGSVHAVFLAIVLKENGTHIGNIKLGNIDWIHRFADVGLLIGEKDCWAKGYATEAIKLATEYAFGTLNLGRLTAGVYSANTGSLRAFEKAGWEREGVQKLHYFCEGGYVDRILMAANRSDRRQ